MIWITALAGVFDAIGLIPITESFLGVIFWVFLNVYLWTKGYGLLNWRVVTTEAISIATSLFPVIQALPNLTLGAMAIFAIIRFQDKTGISVTNLAKGKITKGVRTPVGKMPLNTSVGGESVRLPRS